MIFSDTEPCSVSRKREAEIAKIHGMRFSNALLSNSLSFPLLFTQEFRRMMSLEKHWKKTKALQQDVMLAFAPSTQTRVNSSEVQDMTKESSSTQVGAGDHEQLPATILSKRRGQASVHLPQDLVGADEASDEYDDIIAEHRLSRFQFFEDSVSIGPEPSEIEGAGVARVQHDDALRVSETLELTRDRLELCRERTASAPLSVCTSSGNAIEARILECLQLAERLCAKLHTSIQPSQPVKSSHDQLDRAAVEISISPHTPSTPQTPTRAPGSPGAGFISTREKLAKAEQATVVAQGKRESLRAGLKGKPVAPAGGNKSTIGLILHGCVVERCMSKCIGAPDEEQGRVCKGDVVRKVDGQPVSKETIADALTGSDVPGTRLELEILRPEAGGGAQQLKVTLTRMPAAGQISSNRLRLHSMLISAKQDALLDMCDEIMAHEVEEHRRLTNKCNQLMYVGAGALEAQVELLEINQLLSRELRSQYGLNKRQLEENERQHQNRREQLVTISMQLQSEVEALATEHKDVLSQAVHERKHLERGFQRELERLQCTCNSMETQLLKMTSFRKEADERVSMIDAFHTLFLGECESYAEKQRQVLGQIELQVKTMLSTSSDQYQQLLKESEVCFCLPLEHYFDLFSFM